MILTPEQRAEWRKLADAATEGPWAATYGERELARVWGPDESDVKSLATITGFETPSDGCEDATFIAAARDAVPALLDALDAALARIEKVRAVHEPLVVYKRDYANGIRVHEQFRREVLTTLCRKCSSPEVIERTEDGRYLENWIGSGSDEVPWPCSTLRALDGEVEV